MGNDFDLLVDSISILADQWYNHKMKKLYRSRTNRIFGGILGGLGEYFEVDPVVLRLAWLFFMIFTGLVPGFIFYILALFVVPKTPTALQ